VVVSAVVRNNNNNNNNNRAGANAAARAAVLLLSMISLRLGGLSGPTRPWVEAAFVPAPAGGRRSWFGGSTPMRGSSGIAGVDLLEGTVVRFGTTAMLAGVGSRSASSSSSSSSSSSASAEMEDGDDDDEEEDCPFPTSDPNHLSSPALVRGTPLTSIQKRRNKQFVHAVKAFVFDNLYGDATTTHRSVGLGSSEAVEDQQRQEQQEQQDQRQKLRRCYARFHALETIARMPYFAYLSALHLLETLGQWRRAEYLKLHFAEAWNEMHHLLILEELLAEEGGPVRWRDQFVSQHLAVGYYWAAVIVYLANPALAYNVNQAVEEEAYETYDAFLTARKSYLEGRPAPGVARRYYAGPDLYLFDAMHHAGNGAASGPPPRRRRPKCETLYDTFVNIRDDEMEHVKTMAYLQGECRGDATTALQQPRSHRMQPPSRQEKDLPPLLPVLDASNRTSTMTGVTA
jgi:ubiquinol oxidase